MRDDEQLWDVVAVLVSAVSTTLEKLDRIAEKLSDIAALTEAVYTQQVQEILEREREQYVRRETNGE